MGFLLLFEAKETTSQMKRERANIVAKRITP
jgi:hypothetical protein